MSEHEHDFTERSDSQLSERLMHLYYLTQRIGYTGLRGAQIKKEMEYITLEQVARYAERNGGSVIESWKEYGNSLDA